MKAYHKQKMEEILTKENVKKMSKLLKENEGINLFEEFNEDSTAHISKQSSPFKDNKETISDIIG